MIADFNIQTLGTVFFAMAVLHTFIVGQFRKIAHLYPERSFKHALFHWLGEVEVVFGLWAVVFSLAVAALKSPGDVIEYLESISFTEPIFVFCIMIVSATKPILWAARNLVATVGRIVSTVFRIPSVLADVCVLFILGPLFGSFITESGAITVTALLLSKMISKNNLRLNYALLAVLFVNVSVGGALTPYAAPPILMVAKKWSWGFSEIFTLFGIHAIVVVLINTFGLIWFFRSCIRENLVPLKDIQGNRESMPLALVGVHYACLILMVLSAHHPTLCVVVLLFFLGIAAATPDFQSAFKYRESLLVAFFLAGLMYFGPFQAWWLQDVLAVVKDHSLLLMATALTAITDNAALTFLGSQVEGLSESSKYFLVSGAIAGGGLTIIANAPNPAGFAILQKYFPDGLSAFKLFRAAILPTTIAVLVFSII